MSDSEAIEAWDPALRAEVGGALASELASHAARAKEIAEALAPEGPGPGVRVGVYESTLVFPKRSLRFQAAYPELRALFEALRAGDPGALEVALEIARRIDPEAAVPHAARLLARSPWRMLGLAISRVLGAAASERAFELLLAHRREHYVCNGLADVRYADGASRARSALEELGELTRPGLDPKDRVIAEGLLRYLVRFDPAYALPRIARLYRDGRDNIVSFAGSVLVARGDAESLAVAIEGLGRDEGRERIALRALLHRDPARAMDELGGVEVLALDEGRVNRLLELVARDADDAKRGRPSEGWLAADPRFAELAVRVRTGKATKDVAAWLLLQVPDPPAPPPRKRPKPKAPSAALLRELDAHREAIARLVLHLDRIGYAFAARDRAHAPPTEAGARAIAALEGELGPIPAALRAFWERVGSVDLRGQDPSWPRTACLALPGVREDGPVWITDPLVIAAPEALAEDALESAVPGAPHALAFAPDAMGKAGYSAGALTLWLPASAVDPKMEGGVEETLRAHVKRSLKWAGMPGLEAIPERPEAWLRAARAAMRG